MPDRQCATVKVMNDSYFAGLFDGEGTLRIGFNKQQYQLLVSLGMTDARPPQALHARFGGWMEHRPNTGTGWKPVFIWRGSSKAALALLDAIEDELVVKRPHAVVARQFQALLTARTSRADPLKAALYEEMRKLNAKGV